MPDWTGVVEVVVVCVAVVLVVLASGCFVVVVVVGVVAGVVVVLVFALVLVLVFVLVVLSFSRRKRRTKTMCVRHGPSGEISLFILPQQPCRLVLAIAAEGGIEVALALRNVPILEVQGILVIICIDGDTHQEVDPAVEVLHRGIGVGMGMLSLLHFQIFVYPL